MHKFFVLLAMVAISISGGVTAAAASPSKAQPAKGVVRVKLQQEVARKVGKKPMMKKKGSSLQTGVTALDASLGQIQVTGIRPMLPPDSPYAARHAKYGLDRWYVVTFDEGVSSETARKKLALTPGVEISETVTPMVLKEGDGGFRKAAAAPRTEAYYPFNDPRLPQQWHYQNFGTIGGSVAGSDINLFNAWKKQTGTPDVVVAIIDGGVDYKHEDLSANMHVNLAELNGTPGVDDDGNGYVDDIYGYNFCTNSGEIYPHNHGTHVAGTVAAVNNNGIGVAGVAGGNGLANSGVRMMSCQVFDPRNGAGDGDFAAALVYAADNGASIAQCSWGWDSSGYYEQAVLDAIDYFTNEAGTSKMKGGLCIFATGNNGEGGDYYPACYEPVVAVAAMTNDFKPASYSNYGPYVDVLAPGGLLDYGETGGVLSTLPNNSYGFNEGTSMATPHVSGIAALILSQYGSPTFVNESLRTQLVTSVNDFYGIEGNERYEGNYGSGYIDADKALTMGDGAAPSPVDDFTLDAAQDYVSVSWTIPASGDNNVHHHLVYYSASPFTADDLSNVSSVIADTKFLSSGDSFTQEITGLKPMTTYYIAVQAVNRWGNAAPLSPVKSVMTNAGPEMTVDATSLSMSSTAAEPVAKASFNIGNTADGLLKWSADKSTVSVSPKSLARPNIGNVAPFKGKVEGKSLAAYSRVPADYKASDFPLNLKYYDYIQAYIGDTDRSLPNSMAQWFYVDPEKYPDGFNLTQIVVDGANGANPVVQIYKGDVTISSATLLQTVDYQYFAYGYPMNLQEQIYFRPGESFWIAVHFDGNQEGYPLGMAHSVVGNASSYSYMSTDKGRTWSLLENALKGSNWESMAKELTWGITARSANPDWSDMLELTPKSGTVRKGEMQTVEVSADGSKLVNGTYKFSIKLQNNQSDNNEVKIPVSYSVKGNEPSVVMPKIVDFGSLLVGQTKTMTVEAFNEGYGSFRGSQWGAALYNGNITVSNENFRGPKNGIPSGFPARATTTFDVTFAPTSGGSHTGNVIFTDADGREVRLVVQGSATEPSKLTLDPATVDAGILNVGDEPSIVKFKVGNAGKYPLEYVFPKFSSETVSGQTAKNHKFGYTVASTLEGYNEFAYDGNPDLIGATAVQSKFSDDVYVSDPISLGFAFPYYGKNYEQVYITSFGGLMFAPNTATFVNPLTPDSYGVAGTGLISAYGRQLMMNSNSKVAYAKQDGKFVVKFENVLATVYDKEYTPISFHLTLAANGDIEIFYDDYDPSIVFQEGSTLFCGINDPEVADEITLTSADMADYWGSQTPTVDNTRFRSFGSGTAVKFEAPKANFILSLNSPAGIVNPGESVEISATVQANSGMDAGQTFNNLAIITNDPAPEHSAVRINAVIDGAGLVPGVALDSYDLDAGDVFRTSVVKLPVTVKNTGHRDLEVTAASLAGTEMTLDATLPFTLKPGLAKDLVVTVPTSKEGAVSDVLTVTTSVGEVKANIRANVIGVPTADIAPEQIEETVESGAELVKEITVTNNGNETLLYSVVPDPIASMTLPENSKATTSYNYTFSGDDSSVKFDWVDIETNGLGEQHTLSDYMLHDYVEVELPFEFPFYGKTYRKMYVYNTGFVSFTKRNDDKIWPEPPADFPGGSVYTNIIAPYWGLHSMDQTKTAGTFHYVTDDRAVVSFMEYGNSMNFGVDFQLILEKDGTFKFQYKGNDEYAVLFNLFGLAGIADQGGKNFVKLPERMVTFDQAVSFYPVVQSPVEPGQSETIRLDFDTRRMAGTYETAINVNTNVPGKEKIEIPVSMTLTGEAKPVWPADVTVENVLGYQSTDYSNPLVQIGAMYDAPFKVANEGSAYFNINMISVGGPTILDPWYGEEVPVFRLFVNGPEYDWDGNPTGKNVWQMYQAGSPLSVGSQPLEFSVPMLPNEYAYMPGEYDVPVTFSYTTEQGDFKKTVNVKFVVTPAPAMALDKEEIIVKAPDNENVINESVSISNDGEYTLKYSLRLDPTGVGEEAPDTGGGGIDPMGVKAVKRTSAADMPEMTIEEGKLKVKRRASSAFDVPSDFDFLNSLYYPAVPGTNIVYNYGSNSTYDIFKEAVSFKAPAEGFNISHIYIPVTIQNETNYNVDFKIVQGSDPAGENVLGTASLLIESQKNPNEGKFFVVPLDKSTYINPDEEFTVVVTYPAGVGAPGYVVAKEEAVVSGRYQAYKEDYGWYDVGVLFKEQYGSLGWILSCLETEAGTPWITLLTPEGDATVEPGESTEIKVAVNPATARMEKNNKAMLVIKSNDPNAPLVNLPVILDCNGKPVIDAPAGTVFAREGETTEVNIIVTEPDGEDFTVAIDDADGYAAIASVVASEADAAAQITANEDGSYTVANVSGAVAVNVALTADFGNASKGHSFKIEAADAKGYTGKARVLYDIEHVNRAPEAKAETVVEIAPGQASGVIDFASMFTDPDGDEMTFAFEMAANGVADAFTTDYGVIFAAKSVGEATATVKATDAAGDSADGKIKVTVKETSGIDGIDAENGDLRVNPNPVSDTANVICGFSASKAEFAIYSTNGQIIDRKETSVSAGETVTLDMTSASAGVYLLTVKYDGLLLTRSILKK